MYSPEERRKTLDTFTNLLGEKMPNLNIDQLMLALSDLIITVFDLSLKASNTEEVYKEALERVNERASKIANVLGEYPMGLGNLAEDMLALALVVQDTVIFIGEQEQKSQA